MTVREILKLAASCLGESEQFGSLDGDLQTEAAQELLDCYNVVENEIATDYFPLKSLQTFDVKDGKLLYSDFSPSPVVDVISVRDRCGNKLRFRCFTDHCETENGEVTVLFTYAPAKKQIGEDSDYGGKVSARLMAFGTVSEYLLRTGRYEAAKLWAIRYRDCLRAAGILRRSLSVRSRRWA